MIDKIQAYWNKIQTLLDIDGDVWVGAFAFVFIVRLLAPFKGYPHLTASEAAVWSATIGSFAYSNRGPKI